MDLSRAGQFHFPNHDFEAREVGELDSSNPHLAAEGRGGGGLDPLPDRLEVDPAGGESDGDDSEDANDAHDPCDRLDDLPQARHRHRRGEACMAILIWFIARMNAAGERRQASPNRGQAASLNAGGIQYGWRAFGTSPGELTTADGGAQASVTPGTPL